MINVISRLVWITPVIVEKVVVNSTASGLGD